MKIDRSFVSGLDDPDRRHDNEIVASIIGLATRLGYDVIAEGVETHAQANRLRAMGCRRAQGFLWSPAIRRNELHTLLAETHDVA